AIYPIKRPYCYKCALKQRLKPAMIGHSPPALKDVPRRLLGGKKMNVTLFHCGPAANESELKGFEQLKNRLQSAPGNDDWVLFTNLAFSVTHQLQADEIDIVVIGPTGVRVIEIKHWTAQWVDEHKDQVEHEADKVTNKARKVGSTLRRYVPGLPR